VEWTPWANNWLVRAEYLNYNFGGSNPRHSNRGADTTSFAAEPPAAGMRPWPEPGVAALGRMGWRPALRSKPQKHANAAAPVRPAGGRAVDATGHSERVDAG
jgi:hypothetical protein